MSGALDYGFLGKVMDLMGFEAEEQIDTIYKLKRVERIVRDSGKKNGS